MAVTSIETEGKVAAAKAGVTGVFDSSLQGGRSREKMTKGSLSVRGLQAEFAERGAIFS